MGLGTETCERWSSTYADEIKKDMTTETEQKAAHPLLRAELQYVWIHLHTNRGNRRKCWEERVAWERCQDLQKQRCALEEKSCVKVKHVYSVFAFGWETWSLESLQKKKTHMMT